MRARARLVVAAAAWVLLGVGCARPAAPARVERTATAGGGRVTDNIARSQYAGSKACEPCHADVAASWARSPMHRMTRPADVADVEAPFDGTTFHFKDDVAVLESRGGARFVRLDSKHRGARELYRVTRIIGGRTREDFAGVLVSGDADPGTGREEMVLPVSYLRFTRTLRYKGYSVLVHERAGLEAGPPYSKTCILCHNTAPYLSSLYGALGGRRMTPYQGEVVDRLLPDASRWAYAARDARAMRRALEGEVAFLGGDATGAGSEATVGHAIEVTRNRLGPGQLVELGVGCESCHGGSREHAREPSVLPSYEPLAPWLAVTSATPHERTRAEQINHVCARCHQVLFTHYPWTWEGGRRRALPGGSSISSGEGRDFLLGGCASAMSCTRCHDPHGGGSPSHLPDLETPAGNVVCLGCHQALRDVASQRAHSHHAPDGKAGACIACHMPKKNMSLDVGLSRYHRIGSPTDPLRVLGDRPLECALCHADKTTQELVVTMERWWNKSYDRDALIKLYGDLGARPLLATLERGKPHEQAVALFVLGRNAERAAAPSIARALAADLPLVRQYARDALGLALGKPCPIRLEGELSSIEREADACLAPLGLGPVAWPARAPGPEAPAEPLED